MVLDEINELSNINVSFENVKNGKEVVAIKPIFKWKNWFYKRASTHQIYR